MAHTVLSAKHLFGILEGLDDCPSFSTVRRWAEGKTPIPEWVLREVAKSLDLPPTTQKSPPQSFDWDGLMATVKAVAVAVDARIGESLDDRIARLAAEDAAARQRLDDDVS